MNVQPGDTIVFSLKTLVDGVERSAAFLGKWKKRVLKDRATDPENQVEFVAKVAKIDLYDKLMGFSGFPPSPPLRKQNRDHIILERGTIRLVNRDGSEKRKQDNYFTVANNDGSATDGRWTLTVKRGEIKTIQNKRPKNAAKFRKTKKKN